jgi:2-keto-4-pentenoate hydratase/2-oxohepta-3-ene-1,7-dioic acid hydratase in catechol pathway
MLIRNIWAVGRNYSEHARELGNEVPSTPLFFMKAGSAATVNSNEILLPHWSENVHHEIELALKFNSHLQITEAAVCLDLTERNLQTEAKKEGKPWTLAKSFKDSCPVSPFFSIKRIEELAELDLKLWVNDELRQSGNTRQMVFNIPQLVEYALEHFPVCQGDLLLTGTPSGVGPLKRGDKVKAQIVNQITHQWQVI